jgi:Right handed beta helix region
MKRLNQCQFSPAFLATVLTVLFGAAFLCAASPVFGAEMKSVRLPAEANSQDIQKALDSIPDGGEVVLPEGTFKVSQPIALRQDHQTLRGSGFKTVLLLADNANCPVVIMGSPVRARRDSTSNIRLADLLIDGNRRNQKAELWKTARDGSQINNNGISMWDVTDAIVENVACRNCRSGGLVLAQTRRIIVRDFSAFDNEYDGLACYFTEDCKFSDLSLHDNLAAGMSLDLSFNHNQIACAQLSGNDLGVFMRDSRGNLFQSLTIDRSHNHGVFIAQTAEPTRNGWKLVPGTECTDNVFNAPVITNCGGYGFLIANSSCSNNLVTDAVYGHDIAGTFARSDEKAPSLRTLSVP